MLTLMLKSYSQFIHFKKTLKNSIYYSFRLKKHLVLIRKKIHLIKQKLFKLRTFHFN